MHHADLVDSGPSSDITEAAVSYADEASEDGSAEMQATFYFRPNLHPRALLDMTARSMAARYDITLTFSYTELNVQRLVVKTSMTACGGA